jgi:hypothetical protein
MRILIGISEIVYGLMFIALNWRYRFGERYYYLVAINRAYLRSHWRVIGKAIDTQERLLERSLKVEVPKKTKFKDSAMAFLYSGFRYSMSGDYRSIEL